MLTQQQLAQFVREKVTRREQSLFGDDLELYREVIRDQLSGAKVLVIGGAGSIGQAFIKTLLPFGPASLAVVDRDENGLAELTRDLRATPGLSLPEGYLPLPLDFGQPEFRRMFDREGPFDLVAHFAAHKHVRSEKDVYAIEALLRNNFFYTLDLLEMLAQAPPRAFFSVSTDKAAAPVNVMGASKRLMEAAVLAYAEAFTATSARFANVAFSNGSLPWGFLQRLARQQPLSGPSGIQRYFISQEEAGQLCLLAALTGKSGEVFFPILQERDLLSFQQMAEELLTFLGRKPIHCQTEAEARDLAAGWREEKSYPLFFRAGDTSGEKPVEVFTSSQEKIIPSRYRKIGLIRAPAPVDRVGLKDCRRALETLFRSPRLRKEQLIAALAGWVPDFAHRETGQRLDDRM